MNKTHPTILGRPILEFKKDGDRDTAVYISDEGIPTQANLEYYKVEDRPFTSIALILTQDIISFYDTHTAIAKLREFDLLKI